MSEDIIPMKLCKGCMQEKLLSEFYKNHKTGGYSYHCKECTKKKVEYNRLFVNPEKKRTRRILNGRAYRKKMKGSKEDWCKRTYRVIRYRNKVKFGKSLTFSLKEFLEWLNKNYSEKLEMLMNDYVNSGYDRYLSPSIDRIDDYVEYRLDNMQLLTWRENDLKGDKSDKVKQNAKRLGQLAKDMFSKAVVQYDDNGNCIKTFPSIREACRVVGGDSSSLAKCCKANLKSESNYHYHGFVWKYADVDNAKGKTI